MKSLLQFLLGDKRLQTKPVLILLAAVLVLGVGAYFVHGFQIKRNAAGLFEQAKLVESEGELRQAANYLRQYLGMVPTDDDALEKYGLLLNQLAKNQRDRARAFDHLEQLLRRDANRATARLELIKLATQIGRFRDAKHHLERLGKEAIEADADLLLYSGRSDAGVHEYGNAGNLYRKAMALAPQRTDIALEYAQLLRERLQSAGQADEVVEQMVRRDKQSQATRLAAGRYYARYSQPEEAWRHIRFALDDLGQPSDELLLLAGDVSMARGELEEARQFFQQGNKLYPKDERMDRGLALVEVRKGELPKAVDYLKRSLEKLPSDPEDLWNLANLLIDAEALDQARGVITHLGKDSPRGLIDFLEARLSMRKKNWGEAAKLLARIRHDPAISRAVAKRGELLLADCYDQLLNPDKRLDALRRAVDLDPSWLGARRMVALSLAASGQLDPGIAEMRKAAAEVPAMGEDLARMLMQRNLRLPPAERDWREINGILAKLPFATKATLGASLLEAEVLAAQDKIKQARQAVEAARDKHSDQVLPWLFLAALAEKNGEDTQDVFEQAERRLGKRAEWTLGRARAILKSEPAEARKQLAKLLPELEHFKGKERVRLLAGMAQAFAIAGDAAESRRLWVEVSERDPENLPAWLALFDAALDAKDAKDAARVLVHIRRVEAGEGPQTAYAEAALRLAFAAVDDQQAVADARPFLARAASLRPSWSRVPLLEATACERAGQKVQALEKYKAAIDLGEGRLAVMKRAAELMLEQRLIGEADKLLRKLPEKALTAVPELGRLASQVAVIQGSRDGQDPKSSRREALGLARKAVAGDSKNHRDWLWLGLVASMNGENKEAETALRHACKLKGDAPETWIALVSTLARTDASKTDAVLEEAQRQLPKDQWPLTLAACQEALGKGPKAEENYLAALAAQPDDPNVLRNVASFQLRHGQPAKAEVHLRKLLQLRAAQPTAAATRRQLALALAFQGGHARLQEAQALLEENRKVASDDLEDRKIKALILARQPALRREAIQMFEGLGAPPGEARFLLAQLYEADGNWRTAETHYLAVILAFEKNPLYLGRYIRGLVIQKELGAAEKWLKKLVALAPTAIDTLDLQVVVLNASDRKEEAAALVRKYAAEKDARVEFAARWLEHLGFVAEAEKLYVQFAADAKQPEQTLLLAFHLGRQKKIEAALAVCDKAWDKAKPEAVAGACIQVLRLGGAKPEHCRPVQDKLTALAKKSPQSKAFSLLLAELHDLQGRYDEAIVVQRKLLENDPKNVVALNNLAYFTALKQGDASGALTLINQAIELAGPVDELLDTRAAIYLKNQQADLAVKDLRQALAQAPTAIRYFHLTQAHHLARDRLAATEAWRKAKDLKLQAGDVHPLERAGYEQLVAELK